MIPWPQELVSDMARRRCVVFLGAGISRSCQNSQGQSPKTWEEFLRSAIQTIHPNQHIRALIKKEDYLTACEIIKKTLGRDSFNSLVIQEFLNPRFPHAPIHEAVFDLDSRIVATPNFDKIYETFANHKASGSIRIKHHYDADIAEAIRRTDRLILKIHGTIDFPDKMIFTRQEYAEARAKYQNFYSILESLALTHTFLFLGCGVNDPDLRLLLEDNFFKHASTRPHIFVLPKYSLHKDVIEVIQKSMNLGVLTYRSSDNNAELLTSVRDLVAQVEQERELLRSNSNW
jgi:hypothetical protein